MRTNTQRPGRSIFRRVFSLRRVLQVEIPERRQVVRIDEIHTQMPKFRPESHVLRSPPKPQRKSMTVRLVDQGFQFGALVFRKFTFAFPGTNTAPILIDCADEPCGNAGIVQIVKPYVQ